MNIKTNYLKHINSNCLKKYFFFLFITSLVVPISYSQDPNHPGILEPALSATTGTTVRIPHTDQVVNGNLANVVGGLVYKDAEDTVSLLGHPITDDSSPNDDMEDALDDLEDAADDEIKVVPFVKTDLKDI